MNSKELNLEILRRHISKQDFFKDLTEHLDLQTFLITKGGEGIEMIESSSDSCSCPGLSSSVVDRVGAGDVVLAVSTLLKLVKAPNEVVSLVSNVAGALSISFLGNEKTIDQKTLVKSIVSLLK
jgi:bifunctional ADP-heptose synthase (sugar kinase/adenylyltransferase)